MFAILFNTSALIDIPPLASLMLGIIVLPFLILPLAPEQRQRMRQIMAGIVMAVALGCGVMYANELFIECDWDTLVSHYGYVIAVWMWTAGICYW